MAPGDLQCPAGRVRRPQGQGPTGAGCGGLDPASPVLRSRSARVSAAEATHSGSSVRRTADIPVITSSSRCHPDCRQRYRRSHLQSVATGTLDRVDPVTRRGRVIGAVALLALFKRTSDQQIDADVPQVVFLSGRAERLRDLALALGADAREDPAAVQELRAAGGRRGERDLRVAAAALRSLGLIHEDRIHNLANRLLLAAAADKPVAALPENEGKLLDELDALLDIPLEAAYERLVQLEPALEPLRDRIAALAQTDTVMALEPDARDDLLWDRIIGGLEPILGPASNACNPVARSVTAFGLARIWLARVSGATLLDT